MRTIRAFPLILLGLISAGQAQTYSVQAIPTDAACINNNGQIVGERNGHGFFWYQGKEHRLKGAGSNAHWINNKGVIVGELKGPGGRTRACLWPNPLASPRLLAVPGPKCSAICVNDRGSVLIKSGTSSFILKSGRLIHLTDESAKLEANGINNEDEVVGQYNGKIVRPFLWKDGHVTVLNPDRVWDLSCAEAINERGDVLGRSWYTPPPYEVGFCIKDGKTYTFGDSYFSASMGGINNSGVVVGALFRHALGGMLEKRNSVCAEYMYAFVAGGDYKPRDLNKLIPPNSKWDLQFASGINDQGQIIGQGIYKQKRACFLLTPVR